MPKKVQIPYDAQLVKDYITRYVSILQEIDVLKKDIKELKDEFKDKVDLPLVGKIIGLIKAQMKLLKVAPEMKQEMQDIIQEKIEAILE